MEATEGLGGYLEVSQRQSMTLHLLCFNLIRLLCLANPAMTVKNLAFSLTCGVINANRIKFRNIFGMLMPGAIKSRSRTENQSSSLADSKGGGSTFPQRRAGSTNTATGRDLKYYEAGKMSMIMIFA